MTDAAAAGEALATGAADFSIGIGAEITGCFVLLTCARLLPELDLILGFSPLSELFLDPPDLDFVLIRENLEVNELDLEVDAGVTLASVAEFLEACLVTS